MEERWNLINLGVTKKLMNKKTIVCSNPLAALVAVAEFILLLEIDHLILLKNQLA
jgi:hypothetical protein